MNISDYFVGRVKAGSALYAAPRKRGTIDVWHDSSRWVYNKPSGSTKQIKAAIFHAFCDNPENRVHGVFPSYRVF